MHEPAINLHNNISYIILCFSVQHCKAGNGPGYKAISSYCLMIILVSVEAYTKYMLPYYSSCLFFIDTVYDIRDHSMHKLNLDRIIINDECRSE